MVASSISTAVCKLALSSARTCSRLLLRSSQATSFFSAAVSLVIGSDLPISQPFRGRPIPGRVRSAAGPPPARLRTIQAWMFRPPLFHHYLRAMVEAVQIVPDAADIVGLLRVNQIKAGSVRDPAPAR